MDILRKAKAADYIPTFSRHRITIETMSQLDEADLKQVTTATANPRAGFSEHLGNGWLPLLKYWETV